ncbi:hypothetical protein ACMGGS_15295 [Superficieibacter sp. BNK-5]|uniref:hypothetical protein n=1 Tax=Superficieibacter sp. BNK-5 TaxID=3376142 RepID=UPI0039BF2D5A
MMCDTRLAQLYAATSARTIKEWQTQATAGERLREEYYPAETLALATGIKPALSLTQCALLRALYTVVKDDPLADVLPEAGFHFTLLPLTLARFEQHQPLPGRVQELHDLWHDYRGTEITISQLRLVALPGQLLLAGIANRAAVSLRQRFCQQVLESSWRQELLARHQNSPLPPLFWHSTLLRYRAQRLPETVRSFFLLRQTQRYGEVTGSAQLVKTNYNWTHCFPIDT